MKKTVNLDGDKFETDCCEMETVKAIVEGHPDQTWFEKNESPDMFNGELIYGKIGKLAPNKTNFDKVKDLISEIEQHPAIDFYDTDHNGVAITDRGIAVSTNGYVYLYQ